MFIDETGLSTKMARLRGRAPRGERCRAGVPHGHWKTTTFTGALRLTGMTAPFVYDGAMNGNVFLAYVEQVLVPTLSEGDVVVMDIRGDQVPTLRCCPYSLSDPAKRILKPVNNRHHWFECGHATRQRHAWKPQHSRSGNCLDNAAMKSFFATQSLRQHRKSETGEDYIPLLQTDALIALKLTWLSPVQTPIITMSPAALRGIS